MSKDLLPLAAAVESERQRLQAKHDLLPLATAVEIATGHRPNPVTVWRWSTKGCKGVRLQATFLGAKRLTAVEWVEVFMAELAAKNNQQAAAPMQSPRQVELRAIRAAKKLAKRLNASG